MWRMLNCEKMTDNDTNIYWYALKVFYNKVFEIENYLREDGKESYIPVEETVTLVNGVKKVHRQPVIASLMFFRSTENYARKLQKRLKDRIIVYVDPTDEKKRPAAIPEREMNLFMLVTSSGDKGLEYFSDNHLTWHTGEHVHVTGGIFKGAEGYIRRIKGNRRLVVSIQGVCAVATSYIPGCFLEKIQTI